jgi:flagellar biosynthesis chaperone FliJ
VENFRFRLERVLRWRRIEAEQQELKLKRLFEEAEQIRASIASIEIEKTRVASETARLEDARGRDFQYAAAYTARLAQERDRARQREKEKRRDIAKQIETHRAARQRWRLLEQLRGRRFEEWRQQTAREMDAFAHESFLSRWPPERK